MSKENNKRGKYNEKYNLEALAHLEFILDDKEYWMTSLQLAKISGREHRHVKRDIKHDIIEKVSYTKKLIRETDVSKFGHMSKELILSDLDNYEVRISTTKDEYDRDMEIYLLNRHASLVCLSRYNFIIQSRVNSLFLELYDKENNKLVNKAEKYDKVINGKGTLSVGAVAKTLNIKDDNGGLIGRNKLFEILRNNKVLQSNTSNWNIPYQFYINNGYFRTLLSKTINGVTVTTTRITPKGFEFIENLCDILGYVYDGNLEDLKTFVSNDDYSEEKLDFYK